MESPSSSSGYSGEADDGGAGGGGAGAPEGRHHETPEEARGRLYTLAFSAFVSVSRLLFEPLMSFFAFSFVPFRPSRGASERCCVLWRSRALRALKRRDSKCLHVLASPAVSRRPKIVCAAYEICFETICALLGGCFVWYHP